MSIEFGFTDELVNTQYAPLAALLVHYQQNQTLKPLERVQISMKKRDFSPTDKLIQVLVSIFAGCVTLTEVNVKLRAEQALAQVWPWDRFADQSCLSRTLDALTLMNIEQLRDGTTAIWCQHSQTLQHDWRAFLWLDFDLSGLPCGKQAEESQKGYFVKKTSEDVNWPGSARSNIAKRSGPSCLRVIDTPSVVSSQPCWRRKML